MSLPHQPAERMQFYLQVMGMQASTRLSCSVQLTTHFTLGAEIPRSRQRRQPVTPGPPEQGCVVEASERRVVHAVTPGPTEVPNIVLRDSETPGPPEHLNLIVEVFPPPFPWIRTSADAAESGARRFYVVTRGIVLGIFADR